jgi:hypothetical protein
MKNEIIIFILLIIIATGIIIWITTGFNAARTIQELEAENKIALQTVERIERNKNRLQSENRRLAKLIERREREKRQFYKEFEESIKGLRSNSEKFGRGLENIIKTVEGIERTIIEIEKTVRSFMVLDSN